MKYWNQKFAKTGEELTPRKYSTGKTQESVIKSCVEFFNNAKEEYDENSELKPTFLLLEGGVGSGKSSIGLGVASFFNKSQLVVPTKILQDQYKRDYSGEDARIDIIKPDGSKLKICTPKGKNNFKCISKTNALVDAKADFPTLPCNIALEKNQARTDVAIDCENWSPIYNDIEEQLKPKDTAIELLNRSEPIPFKAMKGHKVYYRAKDTEVCPYYKQYDEILNADTIITNSAKFKIEQMIGRMPKSDIVIIDEADEFLDSLSKSISLNLDRIFTTIRKLRYKNKETIEYLFEQVLNEGRNQKYSFGKSEILEFRDTKLHELFTEFLKSDIAGMEDMVDIAAKMDAMKKYASDVVFNYERKEFKEQLQIAVDLNLLNFKEYMKDLFAGFKYVLFMSGTFIKSKIVLKEMYGIEEIPTIKTERTISGKLKFLMSPDAKDYNKKTLDSNREQFLKSFNSALGFTRTKGNTLVHVKSYNTDCKTRKEDPDNTKYPYILYGDELRELQRNATQSKLVDELKKRQREVLFSTNCVRGVDLPDDECRYIIIPRLPYPQLDTFWNGLNKKYTSLNKTYLYWTLYKDKMFRELTQAVARGLRHPEDEVTIICFDARLEEYLRKIRQLK